MSARDWAGATGPEVTWTAGAVARMLDIPPSTLRGWHRRYGVLPGGEQAGRHRRYTASDVEALARMKHLIAEGVGAGSAARLAFRPPVGEVDVDGLLAAVMRGDQDTAVALLDAHISTAGVVDAWERLCRPALDALCSPVAVDVGDCVDVVHLLSWAITVSLHRVPTAPAGSGPAVLLACVEGERHTLALEVLRAALGRHGVRAVLLGAALPAFALRDAVRRAGTPPAALVLWSHSTSTAHSGALGVLRDLDVPLVLAGSGWTATPRHVEAARPTTLTAAVDLLRHS